MPEFENASIKNIKESRGEVVIGTPFGVVINTPKVWLEEGRPREEYLGRIVEDGCRGYICCDCGERVTEAYHIKPECFVFVYKGVRFYLERHLCQSCREKAEIPDLPKTPSV